MVIASDGDLLLSLSLLQLKSSSSLVSEKATLVSSVQQQLDHLQHSQVGTQEALKRERELSGRLESQVSALSERLAASQATEVQLQRQVESVERKCIEHDTAAKEVQVSLRGWGLCLVHGMTLPSPLLSRAS